MTPDVLIDLAKRKNAAHSLLINARASLRKSAGYNKMTERDRDIDMEKAVIKYREDYGNLCDEWTVRLMEYTDKNAEEAAMYRDMLE